MYEIASCGEGELLTHVYTTDLIELGIQYRYMNS